MSISEKIFLILEKQQMSQKEFAEKTQISQSTISDWKRKNTNPSADKILTICEVLRVTPYELLSEETYEGAAQDDKSVARNQKEQYVLETFRGLDRSQKERVVGYLQALKGGE